MTQCYITEDAYLGKGRNTRYSHYKINFNLVTISKPALNTCSMNSAVLIAMLRSDHLNEFYKNSRLNTTFMSASAFF